MDLYLNRVLLHLDACTNRLLGRYRPIAIIESAQRSAHEERKACAACPEVIAVQDDPLVAHDAARGGSTLSSLDQAAPPDDRLGPGLVRCGDSLPNSVFPNLRVIRIAQPDIDNLISLVAGRREHHLEAGQKLRIV
jgi:hypothetical protein